MVLWEKHVRHVFNVARSFFHCNTESLLKSSSLFGTLWKGKHIKIPGVMVHQSLESVQSSCGWYSGDFSTTGVLLKGKRETVNRILPAPSTSESLLHFWNLLFWFVIPQTLRALHPLCFSFLMHHLHTTSLFELSVSEGWWNQSQNHPACLKEGIFWWWNTDLNISKACVCFISASFKKSSFKSYFCPPCESEAILVFCGFLLCNSNVQQSLQVEQFGIHTRFAVSRQFDLNSSLM